MTQMHKMQDLFDGLKKMCKDNNVAIWTAQQVRSPYCRSPQRFIDDSDIIIIDYLDHLPRREKEDGI